MKKTGLNWWSDRAWIGFSCLLKAVMVITILTKWKSWPDSLKVIGATGALVPIHVLEEWIFPGGFHYQYNILQKSDCLDRYPMCRASDMITNLGVTVFFMVMTYCFAAYGKVPAGFMIATLLFCVFEVVSHTVAGIKMYKRFKIAGKTTIYGPGLITAYDGFLVLAVLACYSLKRMRVTGVDVLIGIALMLLSVVVFIVIPENLLKSKESPYYFESAGYYERFLGN